MRSAPVGVCGGGISPRTDGIKRRRAEGWPLLEEKFRRNLARRYDTVRQQRILAASANRSQLEAMPVRDYVDLYGVKDLP